MTINAVTLSNRFNEAEVSSEKDVHDVTAFGAGSKQKMLGLGDGTFSLNGFQDFDAASVDATLWPIHANGSEVVVEVTSRNAAVSATNPKYRMTGVLPAYTPISGSVGEPSTISIEFQNSGDAGIERIVA